MVTLEALKWNSFNGNFEHLNVTLIMKYHSVNGGFKSIERDSVNGDFRSI